MLVILIIVVVAHVVRFIGELWDGTMHIHYMGKRGILVKPQRTVNPYSARQGDGSIPSLLTIL